jgi:lipid A 3-O-deacylase
VRQIPNPHEPAPGGEPGIHDSPLPDSEIRSTRDRPQPLVAVSPGRTGIKVALVALVSCCGVGCVTQSTGTYDGAMTVTVENDTFTGSDNNYTNGIGATWNSNEINTYDDERFVRRWGEFWSFLPFASDDGYQTYASWSIAQEMHTPDEITDPNPPEDDQPYAGVLYLDGVLYARRDRTTHAWALKVGVVGPASQAEDVQKWFHDVVGGDEPMGWDTQMPDEALVNVAYSVAHLWKQGDVGKSASWRLVPLGTVALGNYFTGVAAGMYGEVGWNLVDALGVPALRSGLNAASTVGVGPVNGWSVAFFGGFGGYGVAHYLPLDGTVFHDSRSVDSEPFIGTGTIGIAVRHRGFVLSLASTYFTDMFETERKNAEFGTLSVSWFF